MQKKILLVDDEVETLQLVTRILEKEGYMIATVSTSNEALAKARTFHPDLIILDLRIPTIGGLEICRILKSDSNTRAIPIIMLTIQDSDIDKVIGLEIGADDYMTKPFNQDELKARVKAMLRRMTYGQEDISILNVGGIDMDIEKRTVIVGGKKISLRTKEFDLLHVLIVKQGRVFSRQYLMEEVWGEEYFGTTRTIDWHIGQLRKKLGKLGAKIETIEGVGYRFADDTN